CGGDKLNGEDRDSKQQHGHDAARCREMFHSNQAPFGLVSSESRTENASDLFDSESRRHKRTQQPAKSSRWLPASASSNRADIERPTYRWQCPRNDRTDALTVREWIGARRCH